MKTDTDTSQLPESAEVIPEKTPTEVDPKATCSEQILQLLSNGEKQVQEIVAAVSTKTKDHVTHEIGALCKRGRIRRVERGLYARQPEELVWTEEQNAETINKLLNLYNKVLDKYSILIEKTLTDPKVNLAEKTTFLNNFKALASMVDSLMKRWYLVHRGYDSNTKQAHEDAKQKTVEREKADIENMPPEKQIVVVQEYDEGMRDVLANLPGKDLKKRTV